MPSPDLRKNITAIAALIVPVLAVKVTTIVLGQPSTQQASAAPKPAIAPAAATSMATPRPLTFTPKQMTAMQYILTLRVQPFGAAPIRGESAAITITQPVEAPIETPVNSNATLERVPQFSVTAVMSTSGIVSGADGSVSVQPTRRALINGRPYREDEIVKGTSWKIATIDCEKRAVTLRDTRSDRTVTVNVELPQQGLQN